MEENLRENAQKLKLRAPEAYKT